MASTKTEKATTLKTVPYRFNIDNDGENSQHQRVMKAKKDLGLRHENDVVRLAIADFLKRNGY